MAREALFMRLMTKLSLRSLHEFAILFSLHNASAEIENVCYEWFVFFRCVKTTENADGVVLT